MTHTLRIPLLIPPHIDPIPILQKWKDDGWRLKGCGSHYVAIKVTTMAVAA